MILRRFVLFCAALLAVASCSDAHPSTVADGSRPSGASTSVGGETAERADTDSETSSTDADEEPPTTTTAPTTTTTPTQVVTGSVVSASTGAALAGAQVQSGEADAVTAKDGTFSLEVTDGDPITVERAAWQPVEITTGASASTGGDEPLTVELEPLQVRALRVSSYVASDPAMFADLLDLAEATSVNALVFDTKDETNQVLYETEVDLAHQIGAVQPMYDPVDLIAQAKERGLYTITRIVTFEDETWADAVPEAKLAGAWVNAANPDNWAYPTALAVEACRLGFDEIQFDYVRFPSGRTSVIAADLVPGTQEERVDAISTFLTGAREQLLADGCGVSAAIFGIVMSSTTDERLGQMPETISASVDAVSPMLYPSHYSPGFLGFADPNDHPGPVIAYALDMGSPRVEPDTIMRPWIQGFYYNGEQVQAQIREAEARGAGWIIWNASGDYDLSWLPPATS